jgi:rubrerythrin
MSRLKIIVLLAGIVGAWALDYGSASAQEPSPEAREALKTAMQSEALASAKYKLFAEHARKSGKNELADLMASTANQEYGHFLRWAALYRLVGTDLQNVRQSAQDEVDEVVKLYTRLASEAEARGEKTLASHFNEIRAQEDRHRDEFENAFGKPGKVD